MLTVNPPRRQDGRQTETVGSLTDPDWGSAALLTIDTQVDTLDGHPLEIPGTSAALPAIAEVCRSFRAAALPIVHVVRLYLADGSNADLCRRELVGRSGPILRPDTPGCLLAPGILPPGAASLDAGLLLSGAFQMLGPNEFAMYKPRWGAFFGTDLDSFLRERAVNTVVVAGCNFPNCPRTSIYEASERDYRLALVENGVSGFYDQGRREMQNIGVRLMRASPLSAELVDALQT